MTGELQTITSILVLQLMILTGRNKNSVFSFSLAKNRAHLVPHGHQVRLYTAVDNHYPSDGGSSSTPRINNYNVGHGYTLEPNSNPTPCKDCRLTEDQIHILIAKRLQCKKRQDYADADKILKALQTNGIHVQDKARKYRIDGENHFGRKESQYVRRGGTYGLSPEDVAEIASLVEERARHKKTREYHLSDELTDILKDRFGVKLNDKKREWSVSGGGDAASNTELYVPTPLAPHDHPTHTMDDRTKEVIQNQLLERSKARHNKQYKEADRIRDELMRGYSILIDDVTKEWKVVTTDGIDDGEEDGFAKEARLSQRSAFARRTNSQSLGEVASQRQQMMGKAEERGNNPATDAATAVTAAATESNDESSSELKQRKQQLASLTVVVLKDKLRAAGLPVSGKKADLIERIISSVDEL